MTTTPYKDELIRVIAALGLPDDTPIDMVAEHVEDVVGQLSTSNLRLETERKSCAAAVNARNELLVYMGTLRDDLRRRSWPGAAGLALAIARARV